MRQLFANLRHRPALLAGTFVALFVAAVLVTWSFSVGLAGTGSALPAQRLAGTAVVVSGHPDVSVSYGSGDTAETDVLPLTSYRRVPAALAAKLAAVPGVERAVPDRSIPVTFLVPGGKTYSGTSLEPLTGYGWPSAALTPFALRSGHAPTDAAQLVLGAGVERATGLRVGEKVRLAGQDLPPFVVAGVAEAPAHDPAGNWAVFFSGPEAAVLYGHPGQADLIGIVAKPGVSPGYLAGRVREAIAGDHLSVLTGNGRGAIEDPLGKSDISNLPVLGAGVGADFALVALFVVASAVALSVAERTRQLALLRAVGATPGQVRKTVMAELAALGAVAGLGGYGPGIWLAWFTLSGLAGHQMVPSSVQPWTSAWEPLMSVGAGVIVAVLSGLVAARRASRVRPSVALLEASVERRSPRPLRLLLGLAALGGGIALSVVAFRTASASEQLNDALAMLLLFLTAVAFLGPYLMALAEWALRLPLRLFGRAPGRLASAEVRARPRRFASAVVSVALAVAFVGSVSAVQSIQVHGSVTQGRSRLAASEVVTAPGAGLAPSVLAAIRAEKGVTAAVGLVPTTVYVPVEDNASAEAVTAGPLGALVHLGVTSGTLSGFGPGDIALSSLEAGSGAMGVHVGETITTYLADGTPYRAKVTAIFSRSLGFADVLVPAQAAGGGHLGSNLLGEVLVNGPAPVSLATRYAGLSVASRDVANAQAQQLLSQDTYINDLLLWLVALLAAVALVNTLVVTTLQSRETLGLLRRVGATARQLVALSVHEAGEVALVGVTLGAASAGAVLAGASKALTGSWLPSVPSSTIALVLGVTAGLVGAAVLAPTAWMLARDN